MILTSAEKHALFDWDKFVEDGNRTNPVRQDNSELDKRNRIEKLEADDEAWFKEYFANFYTSEPTDWHKASTRRIMNNPEWFEVTPWARELSKSGRAMMAAIKLSVTGKKKNWFLGSNSYDNAVRLLRPYKSILENNARLIADYGIQKSYGNWSEGEFITLKGVAFRAIGAGQSPRGSRNDEVRPDGIIVDDFDTDEDCRNPDTVTQKYDWFEKALIPTRSISVPLLILWCGNIIAEDCCTVRAMKAADYYKIVNIRDKNGKSTWPQKNTEEMIDTALRNLSYKAIQGEYYNNPVTEGRVFKSLRYGKMRKLKDYRYLVAYTDPSYKKKGDFKATMLVGRWKNEYHVIKIYCDQTTTAQMLDWNYEILDYVKGEVPVYFYIEWPWIDDMLKLDITAANLRHGMTLHPKPDDRDKPDKYHRIESTLEPLNRNGELIFNEAEKETQHMKNTEGQFLALSPTSRAHDDAPDAVEGAIFVVNNKAMNNTSNIQTINASRKGSRRI
ncbi:hypothetical protein SAMN05421827_105134 [Pedobacter terrae]|uniref:Phage terminase large subunit-like protein n=1 Tax=Pedobacter terrae TaxID=405671 RepID=A0A1G7TAF2_9SPHI|nr:hypothetical protein [Pedobacter terrae]SDG32278.1 hypothetical protein SAMN05421827_105134 [Pedobacter terrae]